MSSANSSLVPFKPSHLLFHHSDGSNIEFKYHESTTVQQLLQGSAAVLGRSDFEKPLKVNAQEQNN